jgi:pyrroline-5-carboxylate reductase
VRIGVLGVGSLAEYLIRGAEAVEFVLSPRSAERVARLGCEVAGSNQELVDECDAVLVCLPAATGLEVVRGLRFRAGQTVCSAMAGVSLGALRAAVGPAQGVVAMMPGYANAYGMGPSLLYPADPFWAGFLGHVGPVHEFDTAEGFEVAAVMGAMSGATVFLMRHLAGWFAGRGLDPALARQLVAEVLRGNAEVLLRSQEDLDAITAGVTTPGGITEQLVAVLRDRGALGAWDEAMDAVLARMGLRPDMDVA